MNRIARTAIITFTVCMAVIILAGGFLFLVLAKPHWSSTLYLANFLITRETPEIPDGFTGTWRRWDEEANLIYSGQFENGSPVGTHYSWWPDGSKKSEDVHDGMEIIRSQMWYPPDDQGHSQLYVDSDSRNDPVRVVMYYGGGQKKKEVIRSNTKGTVIVRTWDEEGGLTSETKRRIGEDIQQAESTVPSKAAPSASSDVR